MSVKQATELWLIRHAPVIGDGCLYGRRDLAARMPPAPVLTLPAGARLISSPARRCLETAGVLCPGRAPQTDPDLWEQDFGDWEGMPYAELPDLGPLPPDKLAAHRPPNGESFVDVCARVAPVIRGLASGEDTVVVAHAGVIRAALAMATGHVPSALQFEIAPLSTTRITLLNSGDSIIRAVNLPAG